MQQMMQTGRVPGCGGLLAIVGVVALSALVAGSHSRAHDAPSGWSYPQNCCSGQDCDEIPASAVTAIGDGYHIELGPDQHIILTQIGRGFSEDIAASDPRIKDSPDGAYHICLAGGIEELGQASGSFVRMICFFRPPPLF
ncbi:MAG: hypothetical protein KDJ90_00305 [Nitratireductor sp.]|nr:hypothetical protein [Nitratireductor sp.]